MGLGKNLVYKTFNNLRKVCLWDVPGVFSETVEVDDTYRSYTGLAAKGYIHRTVEHRKKEYAKGKNHINGLEGFWGYLKRKLAAKGGIRRKYLYLFLAEYVWRYNNRSLKFNDQVKRLLELLKISG